MSFSQAIETATISLPEDRRETRIKFAITSFVTPLQPKGLPGTHTVKVYMGTYVLFLIQLK